MRGIRVNVMRTTLGDCTNGGISAKYDELLLPCEDGCVDIKGDEPNLVVLKHIGNHLCLEPAAEPTECGWMSGGNAAYSSDNRFPSEYPLMVHDRQESWELYNSMD